MHTIAYLGPEGTTTHVAAYAKFGRRAAYVHAPTIDDVFHLVEREQAEYGVVPIENSLEGAVTHTLDRFIDFKQSPLKIVGEIQLPIQHCLIFPATDSVDDIDAVYSHPQALAQCRKWIETHLPKRVHLVETNSTSEAVECVINRGQKHPSVDRIIYGRTRVLAKKIAAIGRPEAAGDLKELGLRALPIADSRENKTRFLILGLGEPKRGRRNKTSILFALKDRPGALHDALVPFKKNRINLTKIESRPSKRKAWEYLFFIDFEGYESEPRVQRALRALERSTSLLRLLGSYPVTK